MKSIQSLIATAAVLASSSAFAQYTDGVIKIGVLVDMSSLYADLGGPGSVAAVKLAIEDFGAAAKGMKVEIISPITRTRPILRRALPAPGST
jgi:branched-chain amino acid transport system substrate-binding protein